MKTIRIFTIASMLAAVSLTSCLKDNDDSNTGLSKAEKEYCANIVKGSYTGNLIYAAKNIQNVNDVTDTLSVSWSITSDSTLTIHNFPSHLLAENISDKTLKEAIANSPDPDIDCLIGFITTNPIQWLINPVSPCYKLQFNGAEHNFYVAFYANSTSSFGRYTSSTKKIEMQIVEGAIFMDKNETAYLTQATPFVLETK